MTMISIIVTCFNQARTLAQALESIIMQRGDFEMEIIVGDDASSDDSRQICLQYKRRFPKLIKTNFRPVNKGVTANFISSINRATGKYIAICAADDFWHHPDKLRIQSEFLNNNPDYGMVYSNYHKLNTKTNKISKNYLDHSLKQPVEGAGLAPLIFKGKVPILTVTVMFRKDLYDQCVPWEDFSYLKFPLEDWPTWIFLATWAKVGYLPESTATYRYGHESLSNPVSYDYILSKRNANLKMYSYLSDLFPEEVADDQAIYDIYTNNNLLSLAYKKLDFPAANKYARALLQKNAGNLKSDLATIKPAFYAYALLKQIKDRFNS